jgi:hypothetical protein
MAWVKTRLMGSNISAFREGKLYIAKPEGWDRTGVLEALKRAFTLKYHVFDPSGAEVEEVHYDFGRDFILIKWGDVDRQIKFPVFDLHLQRYYIKEKVGSILIWPLEEGGRIRIVAEGNKALKEFALELRSEDENLDGILMELAIGYTIRWMSFNIGF